MLNDYLDTNFSSLELKVPLFYNWPVGIRFELGDPEEDDDKMYMNRVYSRAISLMKSLHSNHDELLVLVNAHYAGVPLRRRVPRVFNHYIKSKAVLSKLQSQTIPYVYAEEFDVFEENLTTNRFYLECTLNDIKFVNLLKAIGNHYLGIKPNTFHDVFFINQTNDTIFHIYDSRGCDVIAKNKEALLHIYETYNDWILDYDRDKIDSVFR
ncbi:DUF3885 domain-containing protein [Chryseomicrobium imtechense]